MNVFKRLMGTSKTQPSRQQAPPAKPVKPIEFVEPADPFARLAEVLEEMRLCAWDIDVGPMNGAAFMGRRLARLHVEKENLNRIIASQSETS